MKKYVKYLLLMAAVIFFAGGGNAQAQSMKIAQPPKTMYVKQNMQIQVAPSSMKGKVKWKSSNKKIASVSKNGTVTAKKAGRVKITAVSLKNSRKKAVCRITVKAFKNKTAAANCHAVKTHCVLPSVGMNYKVFHSKKEIDAYLKAGKEKGGFTRISYEMESALKKYKKSFFEDKSLCVVYLSTFGSGSTPVTMEESVRFTQGKNGRVTAKLCAEIGVQGPDELWTADVAYAYALAELDKADAAVVNNYKVEMYSADPPIIDY